MHSTSQIFHLKNIMYLWVKIDSMVHVIYSWFSSWLWVKNEEQFTEIYIFFPLQKTILWKSVLLLQKNMAFSPYCLIWWSNLVQNFILHWMNFWADEKKQHYPTKQPERPLDGRIWDQSLNFYKALNTYKYKKYMAPSIFFSIFLQHESFTGQPIILLCALLPVRQWVRSSSKEEMHYEWTKSYFDEKHK